MDIRFPEAILWDMDGVIFDTENLLIELWLPIAEKYNIHDIVGTCRKCIGLTREAVKETFLSVYGRDFPHEKYQNMLRAEFAARAEIGMPLKKGARECLEFLRSKDVPMAIASSTRTDVVTAELKQVGLLDFFDHCIGGDMVRYSKPAPDIFLLAAERVGIEPKKCIVIEDSFNGIKAAKSAQMKAIMVPDIIQPTEEINALADKILPDLFAVKDYLFNA